MQNPKIRLLLVDDHTLVREGLRMVLDAQPDMEVVGEAEDAAAAISLAETNGPDIILMDISMPGTNGIEATKMIVSMNLNARVLGLTVHENQEYFYRMLAAGASGYVLKGATSAELLGAIRSVYEGGVYLSPALASHMVGEYLHYRDRALKAGDDGLTSREAEVLHCLAEGLTNQEVAQALHLSVYTVQTHRANIMRKLGLENRQQLMRYAMRKGYMAEQQ